MLPTDSLTARIIRKAEMPEEHREIWEYFLENQFTYPRTAFIPPFKRPNKSDKPRHIAVAEFETVESGFLGIPTPVLLRIVAREWQREVYLWGDDADIDAIRSLLFSFRTRGYYIVFRFGNERDLRIFCQRYIEGFVARGYQCQPINAGSELIGIRIRKNKHSWNLLDFQRMTSVSAEEIATVELTETGVRCVCIKCLESALDALHTIQNFLLTTFNTALRLTIGAAAIRAAAMSLPRNLWKWRPHPILVTMCRIGGAFRGGLNTGRGYRGPSWMVDTNRMYTWCLTRKLPANSALAPSVTNGLLRDGIYVCTIVGPATFPAYLSVWGDRTTGFSVRYWRGEKICTVLPTSEIEGLRALGYTITTGFGFRFTKQFNLATYVEKLLGVVKQYGRNHTFSRIAKHLGNSVYGKFGESPARSDCVFSIDRPSSDSFPFIDINGNEIDNLWERKHERYNSHQHIDIATVITGYGRSHMYDAIAKILANGGIIAATCTDSIITNIDPSSILATNKSKPGRWRLEVYDEDGITVARNAWAVGEKVALSGAPRRDRRTIELMAKAETVVIDGIRKAPIFRQGPFLERYTFTSAANSSTDNLDSTQMLFDQEYQQKEASSAAQPEELLSQQAILQGT